LFVKKESQPCDFSSLVGLTGRDTTAKGKGGTSADPVMTPFRLGTAPKKGRPLRHIPPSAHMQRPRLQMLHRDETFDPRSLRIALRRFANLHHIVKPNALPARAVKQGEGGPAGVWFQFGQ